MKAYLVFGVIAALFVYVSAKPADTDATSGSTAAPVASTPSTAANSATPTSSAPATPGSNGAGIIDEWQKAGEQFVGVLSKAFRKAMGQ